MAIKSYSEVEADLIANILAAEPRANVSRGTMLREVIIGIPAYELSQLYSEVAIAQQAQDISKATGSHLDRLLNNFGIFRKSGTKATGVVYFQRPSLPTEDIVIPSGTRVSTEPTITNDPVEFVTTQTVTMLASNASAYYNANTGFYEVAAPVEAAVEGAEGNVAQNTITRFSGLSGIFQVTNKTATTGGSDQESDADFRERGLDVLLGMNYGTKSGYRRNMLATSTIDDVLVVTPQDIGENRDRILDGGADLWIKTSTTSEATDSYTYESGETEHLFENRPVLSVAAVYEDGVLLVPDKDYEFIQDDQAYARSIYAQDKLRWITSRTVGSSISIVYVWSEVVSTQQNFIDAEGNHIIGADVLVRLAYEAPVDISLRVSLLPGYTPSSVTAAANQAIADYLAGANLGDHIKQSDIVALVEATAGVDYVSLPFTIFQITRPSGAVDGPDELNGESLGTSTGNLYVPSNQYASVGTISVSAL